MIASFSGKYRFLSNFYLCAIEYEDVLYPSVEHAFQAAKTLNPDIRDRVREAKTCYEAKKLGHTFVMRADWDAIKIGIMLELVRLKFKHTHLAVRLLATGNEELIEGNHWLDRFWGQDPVGTGHNHLGRCLMRVREELLREIH